MTVLPNAPPILGVKVLTPILVDGELRLKSSSLGGQLGLTNLVWRKPPDGLVGDCPFGPVSGAVHGGVPGLGCTCGIYASLYQFVPSMADVAVLIRGWGRIVLHVDGWRAEHGRIEAVVDRHALAHALTRVVHMGLTFGERKLPGWAAGGGDLDAAVAASYGVPLLDQDDAVELLGPTVDLVAKEEVVLDAQWRTARALLKALKVRDASRPPTPIEGRDS